MGLQKGRPEMTVSRDVVIFPFLFFPALTVSSLTTPQPWEEEFAVDFERVSCYASSLGQILNIRFMLFSL